jgi:hypothetical protein
MLFSTRWDASEFTSAMLAGVAVVAWVLVMVLI